MPRETPIDRVLARCVAGPGGCVLWIGARIPTGYGSVGVAGRSLKVHRVSYEAFRGPIPPGLEIDHLCGVRNCVNPEHLEAVTHAENLRRGQSPSAVNARKTHCRRGHPFTPENTMVTRSNERVCRTCARARNRAFKAGQKEDRHA